MSEVQINDLEFLKETDKFIDEDFIEKAYQVYLKREPDNEGRKAYLEFLSIQGGSREKVIETIRESKEFISKIFDYTKYPLRLNLGCGFDIRSGYLNVDLHDFHHPDLVADIRVLDMLPSDYYEEIIAQDCLEHLPRYDTLPALKEWSRLLKKGGILQLRVPNVVGLVDIIKAESSVETQEKLIQCLFGTQAYNGDYHYTSFTKILLEHYLKEASLFIENIYDKDNWLFDVTSRKK
jgi:SAM-dependent methyltransferase